MATLSSAVSLEEYMNTSYSPDCEYVDGVVWERNVGKRKHAYTQSILLLKLAEAIGRSVIVLVEQRLRVSALRVRIPDVCAVSASEKDEVIAQPPLLCVEVLSPDDRWNRVLGSVSDYQSMGVPVVWVVDPYGRRAWIFDQEKAPQEVTDGLLTAENLQVTISLGEVLPPDDAD